MRKIFVGLALALGLVGLVPALALAQNGQDDVTYTIASSTSGIPVFNKMVRLNSGSSGGMMWNTPFAAKSRGFGMMSGSFGNGNNMFFLGAFAHIVTMLLVWTLLVLWIIILLKKIKDHSGK